MYSLSTIGKPLQQSALELEMRHFPFWQTGLAVAKSLFTAALFCPSSKIGGAASKRYACLDG